MGKKYYGSQPSNARIKIDYSKKKPRVSFSFPDKKNQRKGSLFLQVFGVWLILNLSGAIVFNLFQLGNMESKDNSIYNTSYKILSNYTTCVLYFEDNSYKVFNDICERKSKPLKTQIWDDLKKSSNWEKNWLGILFSFWLFIPPFIIYFPFKKDWEKFFPVYQAFTTSKKLAVFKSQDVQKDTEGYYCEIPSFANVICDYKATKDFGKYLNLFEIEEHKFKYFRRKKSVNEWLWYARFYFKKKPQTGMLKVLFK